MIMKRILVAIFLFTITIINQSCTEEDIITITIPQTKHTVGEFGGEISITVNSNKEISVDMDESSDWIEYLPEKSNIKGNSNYIFSVSTNLETESRITNVYFYVEGSSEKKTATIEQIKRTSILPIEDDVFSEFLLSKYDIDKDGKISISEASVVIHIDCSSMGISSLNGIGNFKHLTKLSCHNNSIKELDITQCPALSQIECYNNPLENIILGDVSPKFSTPELLEDYPIFPNGTLRESKKLKISSLRIKKLVINGNIIESLDLSETTALEVLHCEQNSIKELDTSHNMELIALDCSDNEITKLNLGRNTIIQSLICNNNNLTQLNLANNLSLLEVSLAYNNISELNPSENKILESLNCNNNKLNGIDISANIKLGYLNCSNNNINTIDISQNTNLRALDCDENPLTLLNLGKSQIDKMEFIGGLKNSTEFQLVGEKISEIRINDNRLDKLDVSKAPALKQIYCSNNNLNSLNIKNNYLLEILECDYNNITSLNISNNTKINKLKYVHNPLIELDLGTVTPNKIYSTSIDYQSHPVILPGRLKTSKQFKLISSEITKLLITGNQISELDITEMPKLNYLHCYDNQIAMLDASKTSLDGGTLDCAPMALMTQLNLKTDWVIKNIHPKRNAEFVPEQTTITFN